MSNQERERSPDPKSRVPWMLLLKITVGVLVVIFIAKAVQEARAQLADSGFSLTSLDYRWLAFGGGCYLLGMLPFAVNFHRMLQGMGATTPWGATVRAHYTSQLGKYVPGKAIVVAMRYGSLSRFGVRPTTTFMAVVGDTLAMMSAGSVLAALIVCVSYWHQKQIAYTAILMAIGATVPLCPPFLRMGLRTLHGRKLHFSWQPLPGESPNLNQTLTWAKIVPGWLLLFPGWCFLGASAFAVMKAMNIDETANMSWSELPWVIASYAISLVAGFVSMLPGGVGVRELVMKQMIEPTYGPVVALIAPVFHRLVILVSELIMFGVLTSLSFASRRQDKSVSS